MTCKYVERFALNTKPTLALVNQHNIVPLKADSTHPDPAIEAAMRRYNSESIPLLVIIPADSPDDPIILRDVYSQQTVLEKLKEAVARNRNGQSLARGNRRSSATVN